MGANSRRWSVGLLLCAVALDTHAKEGGTPLSYADLVKEATQRSAAASRIEVLRDGRARIPSPMQGDSIQDGPLKVSAGGIWQINLNH